MNARRIWIALGLAVAFIALAIVANNVKHPPSSQAITCIDPVKGCLFTYRGEPAHLRFSSPPVSMQPFVLEVQAPGASHVHAEAHMVGMDMGFNRYDLRPTRPGVFAAQLRLPVCASGRRDWTLYLEVGQDRYALAFKSQGQREE